MKGNIYVVDRDEDGRIAVQALLSASCGCVVRGFRSRDDFLAQAAQLDHGVVLVDMRMSGTAELEGLDAINAFDGRFLTVVLARDCTVPVAVQAMKARAFDLLERPCDSEALVEAVQAARLQLEKDRAEIERREGAKVALAKLSGREREVLKGLIDGRPNKQIAFELQLSARTVEIYRANLMDKLQVRSLSEALRIAFTAGHFSQG